MRRLSVPSVLSLVLIAAGAVLVTLAVTGYAKIPVRQMGFKKEWSERPVLPAGDLSVGEASNLARTTKRFAEGEPVARLKIPRLGLDAVVLEGMSDATLAIAPGRYPGMGFPGEGGHTVFAAHRDSFFKNVGDLVAGDRLTVTRHDGREVEYEVGRSYIVHKLNRTVIVPRDEEVLTLITCYPFAYAGAAPYRYIVEAVPPSGAPATPASSRPLVSPTAS